MELPSFRYHPDPISTGSVAQRDITCRSCEQTRSYVYTGPTYAKEELDDALCPWCIADGSAARRFDATFTDAAGIGGYGDWDDVPDDVVREISTRTPGFTGWQQERWWTHCSDGAAFLGLAGIRDLQTRWPQAIAAIQEDIGFEGEEWTDYFESLDVEGSPTAYVFRCLHCGALGGYSDFD